MDWGESLIKRFDHVLFLTVDPEIRIDRLKKREAARTREISEALHEFFEWARGYDDPNVSGRSHGRHDRWLAALPCPVLRLDSAETCPDWWTG
jgi:hypothetical protein